MITGDITRFADFARAAAPDFGPATPRAAFLVASDGSPSEQVLLQNEWRVTLFRKLQGGFTGVLQNRPIALESLHAMSRHRLPTLTLFAIATLAVLAAVPALAAPQQSRDRAAEQREDDRRARRDSLSDAVRRVERNTRGEVLSAERVQYDGRDMHRVKVVDDQGRVRVFMQEPQHESVRDTAPRGRHPPPTRSDDD